MPSLITKHELHFVEKRHPEFHAVSIILRALHMRLKADVHIFRRGSVHGEPASWSWLSTFNKRTPSIEEEVPQHQIVFVEGHVVDVILEKVVEVIRMAHTKVAIVESKRETRKRV